MPNRYPPRSLLMTQTSPPSNWSVPVKKCRKWNGDSSWDLGLFVLSCKNSDYIRKLQIIFRFFQRTQLDRRLRAAGLRNRRRHRPACRDRCISRQARSASRRRKDCLMAARRGFSRNYTPLHQMEWRHIPAEDG